MRLVILSHDLSVHPKNALKPAVSTTQRVPTIRFSQCFPPPPPILHRYHCGMVVKFSVLSAVGYDFSS